MKVSIPSIQFGYHTASRRHGIQKPDKMCKYCLPHAELELMQEVHSKHHKRVQSVRPKLLSKGILYEVQCGEEESVRMHTRVGTHECACRSRSTAAPATLRPSL